MFKSKNILIMLALLVVITTLVLLYARKPDQETPNDAQDDPNDLISDNLESVIDHEYVENATGLNFEGPGLAFDRGNLLSFGEEGVTRFAARYNSTLKYDETKNNVKAILTQHNIAYEETDYTASTSYTGTLPYEGKTANFIIGVAQASGDQPVFMTIFFESL